MWAMFLYLTLFSLFMNTSVSEKVCISLLRKGYTIRSLSKRCFDIIARKGTSILLIKMLEDADSISREYAEQMLRIGKYLSASPLIIAEKAGRKLDDFVVYTRFNIYTLNILTFRNCIDNKLPFIKRDRAGLKAELIGTKVRQLREREGLSLNSLARKVGVSPRMISKYEDGSSEITVCKALKMYDLLGHEVFSKIDIFHTSTHPEDVNSSFTKKYHDLGFEATETRKVPFSIIARKQDEIILTEIGDSPDPHAESLAKLIDADNLVIFRKKRPKHVPGLTKKEFLELEEAGELVRFIKEF
ncbi:helix-turn-helix domain-containing protein [Candidatus Woesearchaeota archaeon]|nr:helix-turn-helix domain-containing protein [Candidatus Woesearchaeota archaeon]